MYWEIGSEIYIQSVYRADQGMVNGNEQSD